MNLKKKLFHKQENLATPIPAVALEITVWFDFIPTFFGSHTRNESCKLHWKDVWMFNKFVFKVVVSCSFWVAQVIMRWKPFELKWPVHVRFERKVKHEQSAIECHSLLEPCPYWGILALGRFCTDLVMLGPYYHDLRPIFLSITALTLG